MRIDQFLARVSQTETCWIWQKCILSTGYGQVRAFGKVWSSHRLSYALFHGPIPEGQLVRHKCDVRACVNPDHLELGTHQDNTRDRFDRSRDWQAARQQCPQGHPYAGDNLYVEPKGYRRCKTCRSRWTS